MIGKKQIVIGAQEFYAGMASSDYAEDGGLGTSTSRVNPFVKPGLMQATATAVDKSTNLAANIIATSEDSQLTNPNNRILIDSAGAIYSAGSSGDLTAQIASGSDTYGYGITDLAAFVGNHYATSTTHLVLFNTSAWTRTENYKALADASALHPLLVYEGFLWCGDGNLLKSLDTGGTFTTILTLGTSEKIVALSIDPVTGFMLVSTQVSYNPTGTMQQRGVVYLFDGYNPKPRRKIIVEEVIHAFFPCGGMVYVGMGQTLGYWNGNGVSFLRRLKNVTLVQNDLPYKHHFGNWHNVLLVIDGTSVLAYGELTPGGRKAFYYMASTSTNNGPTTIGSIGNNKIGISCATNVYQVSDFSALTAGTGTMYGNTITFPRPVYIRTMRIITTGITSGGGALNIGAVGIIDETITSRAPTNAQLSIGAGKTKYTFDFEYGGAKILTGQPFVSFSPTNFFQVVRIIIYYDVAE